MLESILEARDYIRQQVSWEPEAGIILGTGLGRLVNEIKTEVVIKYTDIPHFPVSTVESHAGKLIFGKIDNKKVVIMQGRFHYYEGYSMQQVTFPVRVMKLLGVKKLFISNVSGSMNPDIKKGDLMVIEDHINLQSANPLTGPNINEFGPRWPDMSEPYSLSLIDLTLDIAKKENLKVHKGVYVAVNGPNLETRAEYRFLRNIGADVVGMSTVPEVIVAKHMNLDVLAISLVTDECDPDNLSPISIEELLEIAASSEPKLTKLLLKAVSQS